MIHTLKISTFGTLNQKTRIRSARIVRCGRVTPSRSTHSGAGPCAPFVIALPRDRAVAEHTHSVLSLLTL